MALRFSLAGSDCYHCMLKYYLLLVQGYLPTMTDQGMLLVKHFLCDAGCLCSVQHGRNHLRTLQIRMLMTICLLLTVTACAATLI